MSELSQKVFLNPVIIPKIYQHLSKNDRKSCLRLNSTWFESCIKNFKKQYLAILFQTYDDVWNYTDYNSNKDSSVDPSGIMHTDFIFELDSELDMLCSSAEDATGNADIMHRTIMENFFKKFATQIKVLGGSVTYKDEDKFKDFFRKLKNVEELRLNIRQHGRTANSNNLTIGDLVLPQVKKLVLWYNRPMQLLKLVMSMFSSVEYLELRPQKLGVVSRDEAATATELIIIILNESDNYAPWKLSKLRGLSLVASSGFALTQLKLTTKLEKLELFDSFFWTKEVHQNMYELLEHHRNTLKILKFPININFGESRNKKRSNGNYFKLPLNFPPLPELTELEVTFLFKNGEIVQGLTLCGTMIQYSKIFPKLERLKIDVQGSRIGVIVEAVNEFFIPTESQGLRSANVASSVKSLAIVDHHSKEEITETKCLLKRISKMFPNAKNPILQPLKTNSCEIRIFEGLQPPIGGDFQIPHLYADSSSATESDTDNE